jgi:hypothetical protein
MKTRKPKKIKIRTRTSVILAIPIGSVRRIRNQIPEREN